METIVNSVIEVFKTQEKMTTIWWYEVQENNKRFLFYDYLPFQR